MTATWCGHSSQLQDLQDTPQSSTARHSGVSSSGSVCSGLNSSSGSSVCAGAGQEQRGVCRSRAGHRSAAQQHTMVGRLVQLILVAVTLLVCSASAYGAKGYSCKSNSHCPKYLPFCGEGTCRLVTYWCVPGQRGKADCNSCFCSEDGRWSCTEIACNPIWPFEGGAVPCDLAPDLCS